MTTTTTTNFSHYSVMTDDPGWEPPYEDEFDELEDVAAAEAAPTDPRRNDMTRSNTYDNLTAQVEGKLATLETLLDAADRDGWHDDTHESDDPDECEECAQLTADYGDDPHDALHELPLELVAEVGRPLTILLTYGGPNIWVEHDLGEPSPVIVGYWGGDKVERHNGDVLTRAIEWYFPEMEV